jgi:ParB family chromosome partitioning protein
MTLDLSMLDELVDLPPSRMAGSAERAPLSSFEEDPGNPRFESVPDEFAALVENLRTHGILQPIVVRRLENGRLRIRFGARRFRAAVQLGLTEVPYVVTEDPRQLDDYAQVAENERRSALQPLELATFIAKKLADGESKSSVARKLAIHPSAVTQLLCLTGDVPPFVLQLYHSRVCRSPQYLYRLTRSWKIDPGLVEDACASASDVGLQLVEAIEASLKKAGETGSDPCTARALIARSDTIDVAPKVSTVTAQTPSGCSRKGVTTGQKIEAAAEGVAASLQPQLYGTVDGKALEVLQFIRPSSDGKVVVRFANELFESEVDLGRLVLTKLVLHP